MDKIASLINHLGSCDIRDRFKIYCPCCGGTRALKALLQLHIIKSLQYNPIVILIMLYVILHFSLWFIERKYFYKYKFIKIRVITMYIFFAIWILFSVIRNFRVHYFEIDFLGNILN